MIVAVANVTGFDHQTLMDMPYPEFKEWHDSVSEYREHRLQEQVDVLREALGNEPNRQQHETHEPDNMSDFF